MQREQRTNDWWINWPANTTASHNGIFITSAPGGLRSCQTNNYRCVAGSEPVANAETDDAAAFRPVYGFMAAGYTVSVWFSLQNDCRPDFPSPCASNSSLINAKMLGVIKQQSHSL